MITAGDRRRNSRGIRQVGSRGTGSLLCLPRWLAHPQPLLGRVQDCRLLPGRGSVCPLLLLPSVPPGVRSAPGPGLLPPLFTVRPFQPCTPQIKGCCQGVGAWTSSDGSHPSPNAIISLGRSVISRGHSSRQEAVNDKPPRQETVESGGPCAQVTVGPLLSTSWNPNVKKTDIFLLLKSFGKRLLGILASFSQIP